MKRLTDARPQVKNANAHTQRGMSLLERSIQTDGWIGAITVAADGETFDGSARIETGIATGFDEVEPIVVRSRGDRPIIHIREDIPSADDPRAVRLGVAANRIASINLAFEPSVLAELAETVDLSGLFFPDELSSILEQAGTAILDGAGDTPTDARKSLAERFGVPPFSVLDARQGYWQARKRAWIALGIQSELGRGENALGFSEGVNDRHDNGDGPYAKRGYTAAPGGSPPDAASLGLDGKTVRGDGRGRGLARSFGQDLMRGEGTNVLPGKRQPETASLKGGLSWGTTIHPYDATGQKRNGQAGARSYDVNEWVRASLPDQTGLSANQSGTSIFDPVLCELVYRWFCPDGGAILDPFAGGSVRGIVAAQLGRAYTGIDLRPEQIAANEEQAGAIVEGEPPRWIVGDSRDAGTLAPGEYDLIFSCPPYADLEVYSDDPRDLSTLDYDAFIEAYRQIIRASVGMLRENRFAVFVVGDVRDKKGFYRNFVSDTIQAFEDAGAILYNEAILVTAVGSLPIRIAKQFEGYRKLGKTHQNVICCYKGDPKKIKDFGPVEMGDVDVTEQFGEVVE